MNQQDIAQLWRYGRHEDYLALIGLLPDSAKEEVREAIAERERDRMRREQIYKQEVETFKRSANPTKEEDDLYLSLLAEHIEALDEDIQTAVEQERIFSETIRQCGQSTEEFKDGTEKEKFCGRYADLATEVYENAAKKVQLCETALRGLSAKLSIETRLSPRDMYALKTETTRAPLLTDIQGLDFAPAAAKTALEGEEEEEEEDKGLPESAIVRESAIAPAVGTAKASSDEKNRERKRRRAKLALATAIETESRRRRTQ